MGHQNQYPFLISDKLILTSPQGRIWLQRKAFWSQSLPCICVYKQSQPPSGPCSFISSGTSSKPRLVFLTVSRLLWCFQERVYSSLVDQATFAEHSCWALMAAKSNYSVRITSPVNSLLDLAYLMGPFQHCFRYWRLELNRVKCVTFLLLHAAALIMNAAINTVTALPGRHKQYVYVVIWNKSKNDKLHTFTFMHTFILYSCVLINLMYRLWSLITLAAD